MLSSRQTRSRELAAYHLSRLENPHQDKLEKKEIMETFPLETLGSVALRVDSTSWFEDFANYHARNFIVKGMSSQQKNKIFQKCQTHFWIGCQLLNVNLLIANIEALKDNPVPSSDVMTKSSSTSLNLFLEETNTFDNSLTESKTFCFDLEEKSSGSTTTHADFSQYDSFIFDLSINPIPPADRSDFYHEKFADELAHIISPLEYDCFCFKIEPELGNLTMDVVNDIFPTREPRVHVPNVLPTHPTLDLDFILLSEPLFAYIVWIFLPFLTYPVAPPYLLSCGNEDTIFDPGISIYHPFMPGVSHRSGTFMKFNVYPNHLNESPMDILSSTCSPMDQ
ncbi:hypothetical protein Tco_0821949 [Tanacetum coccineum]|uniref:Uncharacterized protein n=1 Tax=Tanacetum coccineum TaxID=301880 RepID=A0ABQ5ADS1_9ASTR